MDKYDKQIAKINKKKQKALEKQAKIQAELDKMTREELIYQKAIMSGKSSIIECVSRICCMFTPFFTILALTLPISEIVASLLLGAGAFSIVTGLSTLAAKEYYERQWRKYNREVYKREAKEAEQQLKKDLQQETSKTKETLISKSIENGVEKAEDLTK